jgi:serine/threonine-protein kinase
VSDPPPSTSPPRAARADGLPGSIGRYEVRRRLGEGAMGRVLLAHDPVLDRDVAIKHLRDDLRIPRDVRDGLLVRMRHEARAAARVTHPNLVTLHDMGEDPAVGLYLVFEYVPGPTLKQRLEEEPLPPDEVATMARQLGEALTCAHAAGVLHRDVKPDNVILSRFGAKIADFGIARVPDSTLTHTGGLLGTPAYSAPETFRASTFSAASDQFSLAASLYEAASGRRAFPGDDSLSVTTRIANDPPDPIAGALGLPHVVDDVFGRALAKEPTARFPSCEAFGRALAAALVPVDALARSTSTPAPPAPAAPERRTGQILLGAAVVAVTLALVARTASRPAEPTMDAPAASVSAPPVASASSSGAPRRPPVAKPRPARAPAGTEPIASSAPRAESDAGAPATSAAASASAMPDAPRP